MMAGKTILVVEDNEMNLKLMRAVLQLGQYRMIEAGDGETGLALAREERPDLILMDIQLPGMDGISATRLLKADPELNHIPVFALSGYAMESDQAKAMQEGFSGYLVKPISPKSLLETLSRALGPREGDHLDRPMDAS